MHSSTEEMPMKRSILVLAASIFALHGCATTKPQGPTAGDTSFFLGRYDRIWEVTIKTLERRSLELKEIDKENGTISTKFTNFSVGPKAHHDLDKIADRPDIRLALYSQVGYAVTVKLTAVNDMSTQVKIKVNIEAYDSNATKKWHPCRSKGVLEREILEDIRKSI